MFAAFLCKEEAIMPSQTKHAESEEDMTNCDIVQDLESGLQDIQSSQKVILNKTFRKKIPLFLDSSSREKDNIWIFQFFSGLHQRFFSNQSEH